MNTELAGQNIFRKSLVNKLYLRCTLSQSKFYEKEKQKKLWHTDFNRCILSLSNSKLINSILKLFLAAFVRRTISFGSCINAVLLPLSDVVEYKDLLTKINLSSRTLKLTHTHTHPHTHTHTHT